MSNSSFRNRASLVLCGFGLALAGLISTVAPSGTEVAQRYHQRNRTNAFFQRSTISSANKFGTSRSPAMAPDRKTHPFVKSTVN